MKRQAPTPITIICMGITKKVNEKLAYPTDCLFKKRITSNKPPTNTEAKA